MKQSDMATESPRVSLPSRRLALLQSEWLAAARARLLRRAAVHRRRRVLDLGAGWGNVSYELLRRSAGCVLAVDLHRPPDRLQMLEQLAPPPDGDRAIHWLLGAAENLPLADACCDLVFAQFVFLWIRDLPRSSREVHRILEPGGTVAAIEPDYGGLMEHPPEIALQPIWIDALQRVGANPRVGRRLPQVLSNAGFQVDVLLLDRLEPAHAARAELLLELPLTDEQRARTAATLGPLEATVHLPYWLVLGTKPP